MIQCQIQRYHTKITPSFIEKKYQVKDYFFKFRFFSSLNPSSDTITRTCFRFERNNESLLTNSAVWSLFAVIAIKRY